MSWNKQAGRFLAVLGCAVMAAGAFPSPVSAGQREEPMKQEESASVVDTGEDSLQVCDPLAEGAERAWDKELEARDALGSAEVLPFSEQDGWLQAMERVRQAIAERNSQVDVSDLNLTNEDLYARYGDVFCTAGGYVLGGLRWYYLGNTVLELELTFYSEEECQRMEQAAAILLNIAETGETDLEKALLLHDQLVLRTGYDTENYYSTGSIPNESYYAYGVLINGTAVCDGYAKTYAALMNEMGIPTVRVSSDTLNHSWNMVLLDGSWYHVDCTWDDPVYGSGWGAGISSTDALGTCRHASFLSSTQSFQNSTVNGRQHDADDYMAFYDSNQNIAVMASDTRYDSMWWLEPNSAFYPLNGDWYYAETSGIYWREDLVSGEAVRLQTSWDQGIALVGNKMYVSSRACGLSDGIEEYVIDTQNHTAIWQYTYNQPNYGIAAYDGALYYVQNNGAYRQTVAKLAFREPNRITSDSYEIQQGFIRKLQEGLTVEQLLEHLQSDSDILVTSSSGDLLQPSDKLSTGDVVDIAEGGNRLEIVIYGDVDGNGTVNMLDLIQHSRTMLRYNSLTGAYLQAATPKSGAAAPTMMDLVAIRRYVLRLTDSL